MTSLTSPDVALHASWADAMTEFHREAPHLHGGGLWMLPEGQQWDLTEAGCARVVEVLRGAAAETDDDAHVPCEHYWVTDGGEVIGVLALRTRLNEWLFNEGGHVGYSIRPSQRRRGHATRALALGVRRAGELGIDRVLVTCDEDNAASAATIVAGGGVYEDSRNGKRRYWIATSPGQGGSAAAPA